MNRKIGIIAGSIAILAISYFGLALPTQAASPDSFGVSERAVSVAEVESAFSASGYGITADYEATADTKPKKKVIGVTVSNIKKRGATFTWKKRKRATYYKVQLRQSGEVVHKWPNHKKKKRRVKKSHKILKADNTYRIRVKACNNKGCGPWSKKVKFTTLPKETDNGSDDSGSDSGGSEIPQDIQTLEQETFDLVNDYRETQGLDRLERNSDIDAIAREHSVNMATGAVDFGHDGFDDRFAAMLLLTTDGSAGGAENVAYGRGYALSDLPGVMADGWVDSEGHRLNIVGNYKTAGMGVAEHDGVYTFTQLFLTDEL